MATHFTLPKQQIVDTIGRPLSGAKAYFYDPGTTTPRNVFQDSDLVTPHAVPVVADSYGRFPVIYLPNSQYKVRILTSADVLVYEADELDPSLPSSVTALPISSGGTGATTAEQARTNIGAASDDDLDNLSADVASVLTSALIVGEIRAFAFTTVPSMWKECNGAAISRTTYSALFAAIGTTFGTGDGATTFNLPDMRGEFMRGYDNGRGIDASRVFGSTQTDAFQGHRHNLELVLTISAAAGVLGPSTSGTETAGYISDPTDDGTNGTPRTAAETRPRNVAMMFCIYAGA